MWKTRVKVTVIVFPAFMVLRKQPTSSQSPSDEETETMSGRSVFCSGNSVNDAMTSFASSGP
jgi:hypothetical protein